jgi:hypothetical protein
MKLGATHYSQFVISYLSNHLSFMTKKILLSAGMILFVATGVAGMTGAFFSDVETSTGNTFTAGAVDLKIDSVAHVNGLVCFKNKWHPESVVVWNPKTLDLELTPNADVPGAISTYNIANPSNKPKAGEDCATTWGQPNGIDIVGQKFFSFADIKPGDSGENTISIHVHNNDAWLCAEVMNLVDDENGVTEPESAVDFALGGELSSKMLMTVWEDDGDNILEDGEKVLASGKPIGGKMALYDSTTGAGPFPGGAVRFLGVKWELPASVGNEVQTDRLTADISFSVEQARNNPNFRCVPPTPPTNGNGG